MAAAPKRTLNLTDGRSVGLTEYGDPIGYPVLALHGAPASGMMYEITDEAARSAGLRLIAPDRPGYGGTPPDENPTLSSRTDWHRDIADALGLDRFAILAISGGGPYGTALAARLGDRITALALVSPMGPAADYMATPQGRRAPIPFLQRRFFLRLPRRFFFPALGRLAVRIYMSSQNRFVTNVPRLIGEPDAGIIDSPKIREVMVAMTRDAMRSGAEGGINDMIVYAAPWGVDVNLITAPATLWLGLADRIVPIAPTLQLARSIPGCRLITPEKAGHFWCFNHVNEICVTLRSMIETGATQEQKFSTSSGA